MDQMISELSLESDFDAKAQEIIDGFELQRIEKYLTVARAINQAQIDLEEEDFEEKFDLLIEASEREFGVALQILELEKRMDFTYEYTQQVGLLERIGILETLRISGKRGIMGINGQEYPIPSIAEIAKTISKEKGDFLVKKFEQGFDSLMIVPFAQSFDEFIKPYTRILRDLSIAKSLVASDNTILNLAYNDPIQIGPSYYAHENYIIYYPQRLSKDDHGGKTKQQLLDGGNAWEIKLIEGLREIPRNNTITLTQGGRDSLVFDLLPSKYLEIIQKNEQFKGEKGFTIEDWLMLAINRLHMDQYQIDAIPINCGCLNLGTYLKNLNSVSKAEYRFGAVCLELQNDNTGGNGTRTSVQIN